MTDYTNHTKDKGLDLRVDVGGIELQVREYYRDGEAIIFLHFGDGNLMMWQGVIPNFQNDYRLILVDLRGHGKSDKPKTGYQNDIMAEDVVKIMEHLSLDRAHVIGSSMGAEVGLSMAADHPQKVTSLVCEGALYDEYGPYGIWDGTEAEYNRFCKSSTIQSA
jgi:pimeloyl-ACP methyl ester carboxylesterase